MNFDKYINKVILVKLPNNKNPRYRWIVKKKENGRYVVRAPKIGVYIRNLRFKKDNDYGKEHLLPLKSYLFKY
mgnify:CR=1 FL=1|tara:strand:+ start:2839 stop:3057 length:219 start_codon:yes stop_codon:yes gene_type:complete